MKHFFKENVTAFVCVRSCSWVSTVHSGNMEEHASHSAEEKPRTSVLCDKIFATKPHIIDLTQDGNGQLDDLACLETLQELAMISNPFKWTECSRAFADRSNLRDGTWEFTLAKSHSNVRNVLKHFQVGQSLSNMSEPTLGKNHVSAIYVRKHIICVQISWQNIRDPT